ncbi:hypothetical protein BJ123_1162 [Rhodopseudomonas thermotolerans]|jgi:hypothetical protein|uniref:Uncharacterized protein n=2 Tax=Rhodopseudomonas TaxID=1073 RepID=A0A336JQL8_9BRAD|nr:MULTISPECIES: hypothetical protein [Rhodopseudomonas]RED30494.1 hypothetical protein BJ125_1162 [Rhodopseudomonas pentothenatexigens]REF92598.1 hypothetical protein BJ123_1162 [Rhodopseudomonas thermotolerans]SSW92027.1 hypothetical protein SAMN05892882_1162 [Rhodopseudomonas pentothenatexigens]
MSTNGAPDDKHKVETPASKRGADPAPPQRSTIAGRTPSASPETIPLDEASPGAEADKEQAERR